MTIGRTPLLVVVLVGCGGASDGSSGAAASGDGGGEVVEAPEDAIAAGRAAPQRIRVGGGAVIWSERDGVYAAPLGGGEIGVVIDGEPGVHGLAFHDGVVYWTAWEDEEPGEGQVRSRPLSGGGASLLATDQVRPGALAVGAGGLFWSNDEQAEGFRGFIMQAVGDEAQPFANFAATDLALTDTHLWWTDGELLRRQGLEGGQAEVMGVPGPSTVALALDETRVFWVAGEESGRVFRAPLAGGNATELVAGTVMSPRALALTAEAVYFAHGGTSDGGLAGIAMVPKTGGGHSAVVEEGQRVGGLTTAAGTLYWTEPDTGLVRARPLD